MTDGLQWCVLTRSGVFSFIVVNLDVSENCFVKKESHLEKSLQGEKTRESFVEAK